MLRQTVWWILPSPNQPRSTTDLANGRRSLQPSLCADETQSALETRHSFTQHKFICTQTHWVATGATSHSTPAYFRTSSLTYTPDICPWLFYILSTRRRPWTGTRIYLHSLHIGFASPLILTFIACCDLAKPKFCMPTQHSFPALTITSLDKPSHIYVVFHTNIVVFHIIKPRWNMWSINSRVHILCLTHARHKLMIRNILRQA